MWQLDIRCSYPPKEQSGHINNSLIQEVTHDKYLGIVIDQHLNWNVYIKQVASKATRINVLYHKAPIR